MNEECGSERVRREEVASCLLFNGCALHPTAVIWLWDQGTGQIGLGGGSSRLHGFKVLE